MGSGLVLEGKDRILGEQFKALSDYAVEPKSNWQREGRDVARAAAKLHATDTIIRALIQSRLQLTLGSRGLVFRSKYQTDPAAEDVSDSERQIRRSITTLVEDTYRGTTCDPSGVMTRYDIEALLAMSADIAGDGFALRLWKPRRRGARYATCWRLIAACRVKNPPGVRNGDRPRWDNRNKAKTKHRAVTAPKGHTVYEGIELDPDNTPVAIWVQTGELSGRLWPQQEWNRYEFYDKYGNQNVIHYYEPDQVGAVRGSSKLAPMLVNAALLQGVQEAHMVAKRLQACHPMFVKSTDAALAEAYHKANAVFGPNMPVAPGMVAFLGEEGAVEAPMTAYSGEDFKAFVECMVRAMASAWGLPWQHVLSHVEGVSMASGRIYVDKAMQRGERWQERQIELVTKPLDRSYIREGMTRGLIDKVPLEAAVRGSHSRPRRPRLNPRDDVVSAAGMKDLGVSPTTIFREIFGLNYEDEIAQSEQDARLTAADDLEIEEPDEGDTA